MSTLIVFLLWTLFSHSAALTFHSSNHGLTAVPVHQIDTNTTTVYVTNNHLTSIPASTFRTFHQLSRIYLYSNAISFISSQAFEGTILDVLDISHNRLRSLPSFYSVRSTLSTIHAGYNTIETLSSEVFNYCRDLRSINLQNNLLSFIDDDSFSGTHLSTLYLSNNRLRALPSFFSARSSLSTIYAQHNAIETLDRGVFNDCRQLRSVYLQNNELSYISADAFNGTILSVLDISLNRLWALPSFESARNTLYNIKVDSNALKTIDHKVFRNCNKLRYVYLRSNSLSFISNDAFNGTVLVGLYVSRNRLRALPSFSSINNTLTQIEADYNSIESLGDEAFRDLKALRYVWIRNNSISYISDNAFNGTLLNRLYLSNNRLRLLPSFGCVRNSLYYIEADYNHVEMISDDTFSDVRRLRNVYLQHNQISSISANAFNGTALGELYISYNHLKELPHLHGVGNTLYEVEANFNAIEFLESSFSSDFFYGEYLSLSNNRLRALPSLQSTNRLYQIKANSNALESLDDDVFRDLNGLSYVYLQDNTISFISDSAFNGTSIYRLNISNNLLKALPSFYSIRYYLYYIHASDNAIMTIGRKKFNGLIRLRHIDLDGNQISFISDDAFTGTALQHLNVSGNRLTSLSPFHSLSYITTLDVKNNFIETSSGHDLLNLTRLRYIDLSSNRLTAFPASISNSIHIIEADDNQIDYISPLFFRNKSSLNELSIKNNRLSEFPDFTYLPERNVLTSLSLSHNNITDLAATALYKTTKLGLLELTGNRLTRIPILQTAALRTLCLQDNAISEIPDYRFEGMSLISLNLSSNRLRYFPNVFPLNASIETLDLSNNHIGPVASGIILKLLLASYRLQYIDLHNIGLETIPDIRLIQRTFSNVYMLNSDSMRCDCPMNWMTDFIKESAYMTNVTDITPDSTPCASPAELIGRELDTITFDDLCNPAAVATPSTPDAPRDISTPTHHQTRNGILISATAAPPTTSDAPRDTFSPTHQQTRNATTAAPPTTPDAPRDTSLPTHQQTRKTATAAPPTTREAPRDTSPPTHQHTKNVGGSVQVTALGASLGTLQLLAIILIIFLVYRHVLQRPLAVSKTTEREKGSSNEAFEIAHISRPESNTYAELQDTNGQSETDPYSIYDNC